MRSIVLAFILVLAACSPCGSRICNHDYVRFVLNGTITISSGDDLVIHACVDETCADTTLSAAEGTRTSADGSLIFDPATGAIAYLPPGGISDGMHVVSIDLQNGTITRAQSIDFSQLDPDLPECISTCSSAVFPL